MKIIALAGKKGVGKTTLAEILAKKLNGTKISIADSIKEECSLIFNIPLEYFYDQKLKEVYVQTEIGLISPRKLLQFWGQFKRKENDYYWLYLLSSKLNTIPTDIIIIDDVRLRTEAEFLLIYFKNSTLIRINPFEGWETDNDSHVTENEMDSYECYNKIIVPEYKKPGKTAHDLIEKIHDFIYGNINESL